VLTIGRGDGNDESLSNCQEVRDRETMRSDTHGLVHSTVIGVWSGCDRLVMPAREALRYRSRGGNFGGRGRTLLLSVELEAMGSNFVFVMVLI
jgi:hypothetical protein